MRSLSETRCREREKMYVHVKMLEIDELNRELMIKAEFAKIVPLCVVLVLCC